MKTIDSSGFLGIHSINLWTICILLHIVIESQQNKKTKTGTEVILPWNLRKFIKWSEIYLLFLEKLTKDLSKSRKKFYSDILYGMSKAQNTLLSDIARARSSNKLNYICIGLSESSQKSPHWYYRHSIFSQNRTTLESIVIIVNEVIESFLKRAYEIHYLCAYFKKINKNKY